MIYLSTQKGIHKGESEDAVLVGTELFYETTATLPMPDTGFVCVADGVGGNKGGRTASHHILEFLSKSSHTNDHIKELILQANDSLKKKASETPELASMATTLSGIWYNGSVRLLVHIGNIRVYTRQGKYLKQLTSDHTLYKWLSSLGRKEEAEACNKNVIIGCLGGNNPDLITHLCVSELSNIGTLLLTSDGVHEYVSIDFLEEVMTNEQDNLEKCNTMIKAAKESGSTDDLSVVIVCG